MQLSGDASETMPTDANGHYTFSDVKEGQYRVTPLPGTNFSFNPVDSKVYLFGMDASGFSFNVIGQGRIAAGKFHTVALKSDGTVWAWGSNSNGQLGDGTTTDSASPVQVTGLSDVTAIAAGDAFTVALKSDGTVWAWGSNGSGQLGDGTATDSSTPMQVTGLLKGLNVKAIAAGDAFAVALTDGGKIYTWGSNSNGQLGNGSTDNSSTPVEVSDFSGVKAIAAGSAHTIALKNDRTVWTWGDNDSGQLGHGGTVKKTKPTQVANLDDVIAVAAGSAHTVVLKKDGKVRAWGDNSSGQLGTGKTSDKKTSPVDVKKLSDVIAIVAGGFHTVALKNDGTVWAWGSNSNGQVGDGTTDDRYLPVEVTEDPEDPNKLSHAIAITAGYQHTAAIAYTGIIDGTINTAIWAWGSNTSGQLGDGTMTDSAVPVTVLPF
jgi:alpha-tubulin suppressor-like RCC1 family protein